MLKGELTYRRIFGLIALLCLTLTVSCKGASLSSKPDDGGAADGASIIINIVPSGSAVMPDLFAASPASRTIIADHGSLVQTWVITATQAATPALTITKNVGNTASQVELSGLTPGDWDILVEGHVGDDTTPVVARGTASITGLKLGENPAELAVPVELLLGQTGTGSFSLQIEYPKNALGTSLVRALIFDPSDLIIPVETVLLMYETNVGSNSLGRFGSVNLSSGSYIVRIEFWRGLPGGQNSTTAGVFTEALTIWDNTVSDQWVKDDGTTVSLTPTRTFALSQFPSTDASLQNVIIEGESLNFDPYVNTYSDINIHSETFRFSAISNRSDQTIQYMWEDASYWTTIDSGVTSSALAIQTSTIPTNLRIRVTAANGLVVSGYTFACTKTYAVNFDLNGAPGIFGSSEFPSGSMLLTLPTDIPDYSFVNSDGITTLFKGWSTVRAGVTVTSPGGVLSLGAPLSSDLTLYAQWSTIGGTGPAGGIVFYDKALVTDPAISNAPYSNGWRYMEAAPEDIPQTPQQPVWGTNPFHVPNCGDTAIGTGKKNTVLIASYDPLSGNGADRCLSYSTTKGRVYQDWFVPSRDELRKVFAVVGDTTAKRSQYHFISNNYWTSSQTSDVAAYTILFDDSGAEFDDKQKHNYFPLRPIRAFSGTEQTRVVVYDGNNATSGSTPVDSRFYPDGGSAVVKGNSGDLLRAGHDFIGWDTQADGAGTHYNEGSQISDLSGDVLLYASWRSYFTSFTAAMIPPYITQMSTAPIDTSDGNMIPNGTVIFYKTSGGYFGKLEMVRNNGLNGFIISYVTYKSDGSVLATGTNVTISSSYFLDIDNDSIYDIWHEGLTPTVRNVTPQNGTLLYMFE